jgi:hypothetical protein
VDLGTCGAEALNSKVKTFALNKPVTYVTITDISLSVNSFEKLQANIKNKKCGSLQGMGTAA